jgi:hypothetical protein
MASVEVELLLVALAAMMSPTTLSFSVFALVLGERPLRNGLWFFLGAFGATMAIGVVAAFVLGDVARPTNSSEPKTWVSVLDLVLGVLVLAYVVRAARRPPNPKRMASMIDQMSRLASSPALAIVGAGAALANPGGFIPIALKEVSELSPTAGEYIVYWTLFAVISLLPLLVALVLLAVRPDAAGRVLHRTRGWLERRARVVAGVILVLLGAALLRNGIAGLTA